MCSFMSWHMQLFYGMLNLAFVTLIHSFNYCNIYDNNKLTNKNKAICRENLKKIKHWFVLVMDGKSFIKSVYCASKSQKSYKVNHICRQLFLYEIELKNRRYSGYCSYTNQRKRNAACIKCIYDINKRLYVSDCDIISIDKNIIRIWIIKSSRHNTFH